LLKKHAKSDKVGILVMFYAPWCGYCKKLKPDFAEAATELKKQHILVGADVDLTENYGLRRTFNITGFPTLLFFRSGELQFKYGGENSKESIVSWMKDPQPPQEKEPEKTWADEDDVHVTFLNDDNFDQFIETHKNVLVKFYAPWCGHCKNMKPIFNNVAKKLKEENSENIIAFVDATKETKLGQRFKVKGYPTIKFFQDGAFAWDYNERAEDKILEFMRK
jgi:protein disulfide-isomerase-like protein